MSLLLLGSLVGIWACSDDSTGPSRSTTTCELSPTSLAFGSVAVGEIATTTFTITNTGTDSITGMVSTDACGEFGVQGDATYDLGAGESQTFTITYSPTVEGSDSCDLQTGTACGNLAATGTAAGTIVAGVWQHVAVTVDHAAGTATIHRNGVAVATTGSVLTNFENNGNLYMGGFAGNDFNFRGNLDDFRIYHEVLSPVEIGRIGTQPANGTFVACD